MLNEGRKAVNELLSGMLKWHVRARWYVFAVSYIATIKLAVALLHRLATGAWPAFGSEAPILMLLATFISTPVQSGEELGWRGYALPRLAECVGYARGALLLGVVWACWHLPQFYWAAADTYKQSFPVWALQVVAISVAMAWLYLRTNGSLLLTMLMHAAINNTKDIVPSASRNVSNTFSLHVSTVMCLTVVLMWITSAYFLVRMSRHG
jgi:membrane protease YdiL (CAAX protease family)